MTNEHPTDRSAGIEDDTIVRDTTEPTGKPAHPVAVDLPPANTDPAPGPNQFRGIPLDTEN